MIRQTVSKLLLQAQLLPDITPMSATLAAISIPPIKYNSNSRMVPT